MRAVKYIIIEAPTEYNNEVELSNGMKLVVNTTIESVANINRQVKVKAAPDNTVLEKGDTLIIHHNILRRKNDIKGVEKRSDYWLYDNLYFVPPTEVFLYKKEDGDWISPDPYVFVEPIEQESIRTQSGIYLDTGFKKKYVENVGNIAYINEELKSWGLKQGNKVFFKDDSEYEFNIDGRLLYRMKTSDILGLVE